MFPVLVFLRQCREVNRRNHLTCAVVHQLITQPNLEVFSPDHVLY